MRIVELTRDQVFKMWEEFGLSIGTENLRLAYGLYWPRQPVDGERVWLHFEGDKKISWVSLRPDPVESIIWFSLGIWPEFQNKSYTSIFFRWAIKTTFIFWKAEAMAFAISKNNSKYIQWIMSKVGRGNKVEMKYIGELIYPEPGYAYFIIIKRTNEQQNPIKEVQNGSGNR